LNEALSSFFGSGNPTNLGANSREGFDLDRTQNQMPGKKDKSEQQTSHETSSEDHSSDSSDEYRTKRNRGRLTDEEYEFIAQDIMSKPPMSGYLKFHLPLRYAARTEEVRWVWTCPQTGRLVYKELIGGGKNSDLEYD